MQRSNDAPGSGAEDARDIRAGESLALPRYLDGIAL